MNYFHDDVGRSEVCVVLGQFHLASYHANNCTDCGGVLEMFVSINAENIFSRFQSDLYGNIFVESWSC